MAEGCAHAETAVLKVKPRARGCEDCLRIGGQWLHLRLCRIQGVDALGGQYRDRIGGRSHRANAAADQKQ